MFYRVISVFFALTLILSSPPASAAGGESAQDSIQETMDGTHTDEDSAPGENAENTDAQEANDEPPAPTKEEVLRLLFSGQVKEAHFSEDFLAAIPFAQVRPIIQNVSQEIGPITAIHWHDDHAQVLSISHDVTTRIQVDDAGLIEMLHFNDPMPRTINVGDALQNLRKMDGTLAILAIQDDAAVVRQKAERPMAIAFAFKLAVLTALIEQIKTGDLSWQDTVVKEERHAVPGSDFMDTWPLQAPISLQMLALFMMSQSDNTATDMIMETVGAPAVARTLGHSFALTTRQFFALKTNSAQRDNFFKAPADVKPVIAAFASTAFQPRSTYQVHQDGIEWYASLDQLCGLIEPLSDLGMMRINQGPLTGLPFEDISYKGGNEGGVLSLVTFYRDSKGRTTCLAMTVNHTSNFANAPWIQGFQVMARALDQRK